MENTNSIEQLFIVALQKEYRYSVVGKGDLTTEDLFRLKKEQLDTIAIGISRELKNESEESFLNKPKTITQKLSNQLEILKYLISMKLAEEEKRKKSIANSEALAEAKEALRVIQKNNLANRSEEEVKQIIKTLESEM